MTESATHPSPITAKPAARPAFGLTDLLLFTMAVIWGANFVVVKYATHIFNPVAFTGLRVGVAALFLLAAALASGGISLPRRDVVALLLLGALGNGLYQLFFVLGVARTRAGNASLIVGAAPAFIALIARARGMERVKRTTLVGIGLSVIGVALVIVGSATESTGDTTLLGAILVFLGVICWSLYTIGLQPYTERIDIIQLSAITLVGGAIPLIFASGPALVATDWLAIGVGGWLAVFYSSVISMGVAYFFWYRGLRVLGPTRTAVYSNLQPIVALLVAWAFLSETPTIFQGVGAATIIAGVFIPYANVRLVLFDIDGTLLNSQGMGRASMQRALTEVFGSPGNPSYRYDGKTDKQIVRDTMRLEGHSDDHIDSRMEQLIALYLEGLRIGAKSGKFEVRPLEGVLELLDALEERDDVVLGLLTGNIEAGARIKLAAAGIDPDRFRVNAFGSDHEHRPELPAIAQRRASETLGLTIAGERLVVIGDTPADIECGRSLSTRAIGVASGHYTVEQLEAHHPYAAIPSLANTEQVLETILNA